MAVGQGAGFGRGGRLFFGGRKGDWLARRYVDCGGKELTTCGCSRLVQLRRAEAGVVWWCLVVFDGVEGWGVVGGCGTGVWALFGLTRMGRLAPHICRSNVVRNGNANGKADGLNGGSAKFASAIPQPVSSSSSQEGAGYGFGNNRVPVTRVDHVGAISVVDEADAGLDGEVTVFENVDGKRVEDGRYAAFVAEISGALSCVFGRGGAGVGDG